MVGKYRRYDMIGAINRYCMKNDWLHITYIEKKTKAQLEEIVAEYNINVDEMLFEVAKEREKMANYIPNLQLKIKKNVDVLFDKIEMLESLLNDEQREKYLEFCNSQEIPNEL
jgi:hypothetical protein